MSFASLFADNPGPVAEPKPKRAKAERPRAPLTEAQAGAPPSFHASSDALGQLYDAEGTAERMLAYDRLLFEGLFLRYGKAWVNEQMALLIKRFPSYGRD